MRLLGLSVAVCLAAVPPPAAAKFSCDARRSLPDDWVNDGFCDCADGTDETASNACALAKRGSPVPRFACADTMGFTPLDIPAHLYGDGVCDCCDGSDEVDTGAGCANECARMAAEAQAAAELLAKKRKEGAAKYQEYVATARNTFQSQVDELKAAEAELKALDASAEQWENELEARRTKLAEDRKKLVEAAEQAADQAVNLQALPGDNAKIELMIEFAVSANDTGIETLLQLVTDQLPPEVTDSLDDVEVLSLAMEASEAMYGSGDAGVEVGADGELTPAAAATLNKALVDLRQSLPLDSSVAQGHLHGEAVDSMVKQLGKDLKQTGRLAARVWKALGQAPPDPLPLFPEDVDTADSGASKEVDEAQKMFKDVSADRRKARDKVKEMEGVDKIDFGSERQYFPLYGQCFSKRVATFDYEICPFKDSHQGGTKLGKFDKWAEPNVMSFENGAKCWNGPKRSLQVTFECGSEEEILSVEEPETCTYVAAFVSPAACGDP